MNKEYNRARLLACVTGLVKSFPFSAEGRTLESKSRILDRDGLVTAEKQ